MSTPALSELPIELLDHIITQLDDPALVSLAKTNHLFNNLALHAFFIRNNVSGPRHGYLVSRLAPPEIIPALNAALWLTDLQSITYYLNPDFRQMVMETRGLAALVDRLPSVEHVDVYFGSVDYWLNELYGMGGTWMAIMGLTMEERPRLGKERWRKAFVGLLDGVLSKGCVKLSVSGGSIFQEFYVEDEARQTAVERTFAFWPRATTLPLSGRPPTPRPPFLGKPDIVSSGFSGPGFFSYFVASLRRGWSSVWKWTLWFFTSTHAATLPEPILKIKLDEPEKFEPLPNPSLSSFQIRTSMLLQPLFLHKTIDIFQTQAPALRELSLIGAKATTDTWETLFSSIHLPALETFCYMFDTLIVDRPTLTLQVVHDFLVRHPTIQFLELYGIVIPIEFPVLQQDILPYLTRLDAHPQVIAWFLKDVQCLPSLDTVHITSEYTASWMDRPNSYAYFDEGILTVSALPRPINLRLKFNTELELVPWLNTHNDQGRADSALGKLTNVKKLAVSCQYLVTFSKDVLVGVLPAWLAVFPSVEEFAIVEHPCPDEVLDLKEFHTALWSVCPGLRKFLVCDEEITINRSV
ncbi:hypothetical protein P691DRAFT_805633 [Macrolepiota fuliginosa MF-IS2]|uniref:F-box domain-containing protein n=1 Tax=Macrolepiota fuliginosa MF-IS2 TaxID=1400762 RepID=A0A9P6C4R1_9AGAR|nr:hypothetical protein P691DRAFT_805633 [Macrolepiota fuliginosa MF-IS2]